MSSKPGSHDPAFSMGFINGAPVGVTLRDYFAAKAMQGFHANSTQTCCEATYEEAAEWSYRMADAMMKEREK